MPPKKIKQSGLTDTWGRKNRKIADIPCAHCGIVFRPINSKHRTCSRKCGMAIRDNKAYKLRKKESWWINNKGYREGRIWIDEHTQIRVKQHRWVMERHLGRQLHPWEDVHHVDHNKLNNDISNLKLISHGDHSALHNTNRTYKKGYKMKLTDEQRQQRSINAKKTKFWIYNTK